ncbi:hypothetical protein ACLOJK_032293 [Asimina triloba]
MGKQNKKEVTLYKKVQDAVSVAERYYTFDQIEVVLGHVVYSDLTVDYFKMFLLNVPAAVVALALLLGGVAAHLGEKIVH